MRAVLVICLLMSRFMHYYVPRSREFGSDGSPVAVAEFTRRLTVPRSPPLLSRASMNSIFVFMVRFHVAGVLQSPRLPTVQVYADLG